MLVDTHCHLADPEFDADREAVIARAREAGVGWAMVMGLNHAENERVFRICEKDPFLRPCAGHYPEELDVAMADRTEAFIREHRDDLAAIGEVGIDHWITDKPEEIELQHQIFLRFAQLSAELDLPLSVHSRSAGRHAIAILLEAGTRKAILHAFDGKYGSAMPGLEAGYFFSVPPSIVRARQKQKLVKNLPIEQILLESDAPVLGPVRGERNEPDSILQSAEAIAEIKGLSLEEVERVTSENAERLCGR